jgi:hypothetical protein
MAFIEDLAPFFAEFSVPATLGAASIRVIFDKAYIGVLMGMVESTGPCCLAMDNDIPNVKQGASITVNGKAYLVTGVEPDGTGITTLQLRG